MELGFTRGMSGDYVHGYPEREAERLRDQAATVRDLLHEGTRYPPWSEVLEAGCGVGAQTITLARNSPAARFLSVDISGESLAQAREAVRRAGLANVRFECADIFRSALRRWAIRSRFRLLPARTSGRSGGSARGALARTEGGR